MLFRSRDGLFRESAETAFAARAMTTALQDFVEIIVAWMHSQYDFDPELAEFGFGGKDDLLPAWELDLSDGRKLALQGRIDRVDIWRNSANGDLLADGSGSTNHVSANGTSTLALTGDISVVKQNITDLVSAFNFVNSTLDTISDPKSSDATIGGTLPNNSLVRQVRQQVLQMVTENSSTPGTNIKALRDLGIAIQRDGTLKIEDPTKLDDAL